MRIKERLGEAFRLYFILVTLITALLMVLGLLFDSDRTFGYEVFVSPLIVFNAPNIPSERPEVVLAIAAGVLVVFILSMVVEYIFELTQANEMNGYLEEYHNRNKE